MGETAASGFAVLLLAPAFGAILLAARGFDSRWIVDLLPALAKIAVLIALVVMFGSALLEQ